MLENVPAVSSVERQQVLQAIERLQLKLGQQEEWTHSERLGALRDALQSPLLGHILTLQHSVKQLRDQLNRMPPDTCSEFSFSRKGQLIFSASCPPSNGSSIRSNGTGLSSMVSQRSAEQLQMWIQAAAKGRKTEHVRLPKPVSGGLGFSVVGLRPEGVGSHGVFVRHIQPGSIAHRSERLLENDQILAINGMPLDENVTQHQALTLLQQQREYVELVVARDKVSAVGSINTDQWGHVEEIELVNDGSGLGFGIVGGKATGVVVRTLVPNSVAHKDGRLRTGDHILRIGDTSTQGLASDQVVRVLQQCGSHVRMLIARDPLKLPQQAPLPPPAPAAAPVAALPPPVPVRRTSRDSKIPNLQGYEIHEVPVKKKEGQSLGISIVGQNSLSSEDAVGVYVKYVVPGSAADHSGNIRVHDRIIALDGVNLQGFTNQEVLEVMKHTGQTVTFTVVRKIASAKQVPSEKSLDKVHRESSRVSLRRSSEVKVRSDITKAVVTESLDTAAEPQASIRTSSPGGLVERDLREKWEQALGPRYDVLVLHMDPHIEDDLELQKSSKLHPVHTMRLGVELDSFDGHHYISTINPDGPAKHSLLRPEDELLEVNGVQLYGKSRREAVAFLREVPPPFTLVCCRLLSEEEPEVQDWRSDSPVTGSPEQEPADTSVSVVESEYPGPESETRNSEDNEDAVCDEEDDDEEGELALWASEVQVVKLEKAEHGLGFSILDYQDPLDATRCVFVIRSLVPGGVAERSGGLLPGDQLVFVNDTYLDSCSLTQAVEVLKALSPGTVYLGIRKPLADENKTGVKNLQSGRDYIEEPEVESALNHGSLSTHKDFEDPSATLRNEEDLDDDPELILDSMPRYASPVVSNTEFTPSNTSHLIREDSQTYQYNSSLATAENMPCLEKEMAVDEEDKKDMEWQSEAAGANEAMNHRQALLEKDDQAVRDLIRFSPIPQLVENQKNGTKEYTTEVEETASPTDEPTELPTTLPASSDIPIDDIWAKSDSQNNDGGLGYTISDTESENSSISEKRRGETAAVFGEQSYLPQREEGEGEETPGFSHWGPPHRVEVWQEPDEPLGISIVGGRSLIKRLRNGEELKGIFIKQVLPHSPAGRTGALKTGDKILQVGGVDLQNASHEEAVEAIRAAPSPVVFIVQSLSTTPRPISVLAPSYSKHKAKRKVSAPPTQMTVSAAGIPPPMRLPPPYRPPSSLQEEQIDQHKESEQDSGLD